MIAPLLALTLAATPAPWSTLDASARGKLLQALAREPLDERIAHASERFLGTPYVLSPLGEGHGRDSDPPLRFDAVDCLTFVEETVALSLSRSDDDLLSVLTEIRYGSVPTYESRNHLMEAEWIPSNERKGFVRDVTVRYGGADAQRGAKVISRAAWKTSIAQALGLRKPEQITGRFPLNVLPMDKLEAHAAGIPTGTIFVVVRDDSPDRITRMTHLGFVIQKRGGTFLRHASSAPANRVIDEPLAHFLSRNARYPWKVDGVSLFEVRPRSAVLAHASRP